MIYSEEELKIAMAELPTPSIALETIVSRDIKFTSRRVDLEDGPKLAWVTDPIEIIKQD